MTIKEFFLGDNVYAQASDESELGQGQGIDISNIPGNNPQTYSPTSSPVTIAKCTGTDFSSGCECPNGKTEDQTECLVNKEGTLGINCSADQLINNTCSRNINKTLGIRSSDPNPSPTLLLQDVTLAATSFIGTIIMVAMVWIGINAVMKGSGDEDAMSTAKEKIRNLAIGLLLVISSYTIIRLVQYIARGY